jgi:hypothetical protein
MQPAAPTVQIHLFADVREVHDVVCSPWRRATALIPPTDGATPPGKKTRRYFFAPIRLPAAQLEIDAEILAYEPRGISDLGELRASLCTLFLSEAQLHEASRNPPNTSSTR